MVSLRSSPLRMNVQKGGTNPCFFAEKSQHVISQLDLPLGQQFHLLEFPLRLAGGFPELVRPDFDFPADFLRRNALYNAGEECKRVERQGQGVEEHENRKIP